MSASHMTIVVVVDGEERRAWSSGAPRRGDSFPVDGRDAVVSYVEWRECGEAREPVIRLVWV